MAPYKDGRESYTRHGLAIISPYGGVWTDEVFETAEAAFEYLKSHLRRDDYSAFKLATATLTVTVYRPIGEPEYIPLPRTADGQGALGK